MRRGAALAVPAVDAHARWLKRASTLSDDTAPSASLDCLEARAALRTPERRPSILEARRGLRSPPQAAPNSRRFHLQPTGTAIFGLVGFHCGIAATMALGIIPWLNMAAVLAFVPASAWDALGQARDREAKAGAKEQGGYGGWLETPSTLLDDMTRCARPVAPRARAAPSHPGAPTPPRGGSPWPLKPASGRPQDAASSTLAR